MREKAGLDSWFVLYFLEHSAPPFVIQQKSLHPLRDEGSILRVTTRLTLPVSVARLKQKVELFNQPSNVSLAL
jgi:hypothetical protein